MDGGKLISFLRVACFPSMSSADKAGATRCASLICLLVALSPSIGKCGHVCAIIIIIILAMPLADEEFGNRVNAEVCNLIRM